MTVLYITYNGLTEPLGRRQVLPYILGLSAKGWGFVVLSFEKPETCTPEARALVAGRLARAGCQWLPLPYHRRPSVPATLWDAAIGTAQGLLRGRHVSLIHARSSVPAAMAATLGHLRAIPWIFDVRGFIGREYVDAGHWQPESLVFRLTDKAERRLLRQASGLVCLTQRTADNMRAEGTVAEDAPLAVIPCAADPEAFHPDPDARRRLRSELGLGDDPVIVYSGSLGSWYSLAEMLDFFLEAREEIRRLRLMILTPQPEVARRELAIRGLGKAALVLSVLPDAVPSYLALADAGVCFVAPHPSKAASSPTKQAEYLASGLPVVTDSWTGDAASLRGRTPWITIDSFATDEYRQAARELRTALNAPDQARSEAVALAASHFSLSRAVDRYDALYRQVIESRPR